MTGIGRTIRIASVLGLVLVAGRCFEPVARGQAAVAFQPGIGFVPIGPTLNVTPVVSADRRYVRLSLNPYFISLNGFTTYQSQLAAVGGVGFAGMNGAMGGGAGGAGVGGGTGVGGGGFGMGAGRPTARLDGCIPVLTRQATIPSPRLVSLRASALAASLPTGMLSTRRATARILRWMVALPRRTARDRTSRRSPRRLRHRPSARRRGRRPPGGRPHARRLAVRVRPRPRGAAELSVARDSGRTAREWKESLKGSNASLATQG